MSARIKLMKFLLLFLLAFLLLGTACNQRPVTPPARQVEPLPQGAPVEWRYNHAEGRLSVWLRPEFRGIEITTYVRALDGSWQKQWFGINPTFTEAQPNSRIVDSLMATGGYFIHYGLDVSQRFGGGRFRWQYRFKLDTSADPWRFEAPVGLPSFVGSPELGQFPWEPGIVTVNPRTDERLWTYLNTSPIGGPFVGCAQQPAGPGFPYVVRGIYITSWMSTGAQWHDGRSKSLTRQWRWVDGYFDGFSSTSSPMPMGVTDHRTPPINRLHPISNRHHQVLLFARADGTGPYPKPWERTWWRLAGRGVGGFEEAGGRVRCDRGEWRLEQITQPELVALLDEWLTVRRRLGERIDPRLIPAGW